MKRCSSVNLTVAVVIVLSLLGSPPLKAVASTESLTTSSAHYIVFEQPAGGSPQPVFYRLVSLAASLQSLTTGQLEQALAGPSRNTRSLVVLLHSPSGQVLYRNVVSVSPWVRAEFHGAAPGDPIDGHLFSQETLSFVVRVPAIPGATLSLEDAQRREIGRFDLASLARQTPLIDLAGSRLLEEASSLTGSPANRVDFLIMGDGYTSTQAAQFATDASNVSTQFFNISPYSEYKNYLNILTLYTPSNQSGADHPPYQAGCTAGAPTCCGDSSAASDPLQGTFADTAFDSTFCYYNIHRLLVSNTSKVLAAAAAMPDWDQIMVLANDPVYGGSGGYVSTISMHSLAAQIAQHEYGHTFANLADEYSSPYPGYPGCSDAVGSASPCEPNVTDITVREQIKWYPWILPTTPIPTPNDITYNGLVGLFEGARYQTTGIYRSGYSCIMRALGAPYCQVPSQAYVLELYDGGWGVPANGISLIEPGSTSPATPVNLAHPATQAFHADLLSPVGGPPVQTTWLVDGVPTATTGDTFTYNTTAAGTFEVTLRVKDVTSLVNPLMGGDTLQDTYTWTVHVTAAAQTLTLAADPTTLVADGSSTSVLTASVTSAGTPLAGETVTFSTTLGTIHPATGVTNAAGVVTATLTSSQALGTAEVGAHTGTASDELSIPFIPGPLGEIEASASPAILTADGSSQSTISALASDGYGHPLMGIQVEFTATLGSISPLSATTDLNGLATAVFTSGTVTGTAILTAAAQGYEDTTSIELLEALQKIYLSLLRK